MRCLIRSHHQDYKFPLPHEEGEAGGSLEPDPRYGRCCSSVCRPGYALRDALLGLLVLLGLAVVVTVIFVVCFYVLPDEKHLIEEGLLASTAEGIIREPVEVNEISLSDGDAYNVVPNDPKKSTVGRSQDFNTFSTTANFEDTTTQLSSADASQFTVFQDASDVVAPSRGHGNKPGVPRRENLDQDNFHEHQKGQNDGEHRQNLGHKGERPVLEGEDDQFQGAGSRNTEEVNFFEDTSPKAACGAVQLPMCTAAVPWSSAGRPNWLGHSADEAIFASLTAVRHLLVESRCSPLASLYACSILEPPCKDDMILPPCRNFCLEVSRSCQVPASSGIAAMFECEKFPDSTDPNVCVSAQEEETTTPTTPSTTTTTTTTTRITTVATTTPATKSTTADSIDEPSFTSNVPAESSMTLQRDHKPSTKRSTHIFASPTASPSNIPTSMSLADRLKLAMSGSSSDSDSNRKPANPRRPTTSAVVAENSSTTSNGGEDSTRSSFSLAARLSSVATESPRRTARPKSISSGFDVNPTTSSYTSDDSTETASNSGALSLAERLALLNKAKQPSKPVNRLQGRRQPSTSNNRFTSVSDAPTETPRRYQAGLRNRFTSMAPTTEYSPSTEDGDVRRIPVRTIDEVPRFKLNFPKRYSTTERSVTFRTTAELTSPSTPEGTTETSSISTIAASSSTTVERRLPSTTEQTTTTEKVSETTKGDLTSTEAPALQVCEELQCLDGKCIAINQLNDGIADCSDGSDEQDFGGLVT